MNGLLEVVTKTQDSWFYSPKFNHAQKVNNKVYCYVTRLLFGYQVQLYLRGDVSYCSLEARTKDQSLEGLMKMFDLGESWLHAYQDGDEFKMYDDMYSIENPKGVWLNGSKDYWI